MTASATLLPFASVLVTGANGFVGRRLVQKLRGSLAPEARLVTGSRTEPGDIPDPGIDHIDLDVTNSAQTEEVVAWLRPALIVHLAALSSVGASANAAPACWDVNMHGSFHLARAVRAHVPDATFFFTSTAEVYGRSFNEGMVDEDAPPRPTSVYARTKIAAEAMLGDVLPDTARLITVRPSNHSGAGQDTRFVLPAFAEQIARIEAGLIPPVVRVGNLEAERDFLHVDDVIAAYMALLGNADALPRRATFNVASGHVIPVSVLLDELIAHSRVPVTVEQDPARMRASDIPRALVSPAAVRAATGWQPSGDVSALVADVLAYQRNRFPGR